MYTHCRLPSRWFEHLHAEREQSWLQEVYVAPDKYAHVAGMRSWIILGAEGAGKTALTYALKRDATTRPDAPIVPVEWRPRRYSRFIDGDSCYQFYIDEILKVCAHSIVQWVANSPRKFLELPQTARWLLAWFCQRWLARDRDYVMTETTERYSERTRIGLEQLLVGAHPTVFRDPIAEIEVLAAITRVILNAGMGGIWLIVDDIDRFGADNGGNGSALLSDMLATLGLFEIDGFCLKVTASASVRDVVWAGRAVTSHRLGVAELIWDEGQLTEILRMRASMAANESISSLADISEDSTLLQHLLRFGGTTPRGWLAEASPFVSAYIRQEPRRPIQIGQFEAICRTSPPRLRYDSKSRRIMIGYRSSAELAPQSLRMLEYLFANVGRTCSRSELYYRALGGLAEEPMPGDDEYIDPKVWKSAFDNAIYHLRNAVEPLPRNPIYVITDRNAGVRLNVPT